VCDEEYVRSSEMQRTHIRLLIGDGEAQTAVEEHRRRIHNHHHPNMEVFSKVRQRSRESGSFKQAPGSGVLNNAFASKKGYCEGPCLLYSVDD
jgi:hypothetical protein